MPPFLLSNYKQYKKQRAKHGYLLSLLEQALPDHTPFRKNQPCLSIGELSEIMSNLHIPLRIKQTHELYLYSRDKPFSSTTQTVQKILKQQSQPLCLELMSKWLQAHIDSSQIQFNQPRKRIRTEMPEPSQYHLPLIQKHEPLQQELKFLINELDIDKEYSNSLVPASNRSAAKIRVKSGLQSIVKLAKHNKKVKNKVEQAIQNYQQKRMEQNEKLGRMGAMKAQQRLMQARKKEKEEVNKIYLGEENNLVMAAQLYSMLTIEPKQLKHHSYLS